MFEAAVIWAFVVQRTVGSQLADISPGKLPIGQVHDLAPCSMLAALLQTLQVASSLVLSFHSNGKISQTGCWWSCEECKECDWWSEHPTPSKPSFPP
jgi:hypothetical protein